MMIRTTLCVVVILCCLATSSAQEIRTFTLAQTRLRDPFILADEATQTYYLVTCSVKPAGLTANAVSVLTSRDLQTWTGPYPVFEIGPDFWAQGHVWAPEMHRYRDKYYLFATMNGSRRLPEEPWPDWPEKTARGTQVLVADSPMGPFQPFANRSHTDPNIMALDGTLWVEDGVPYMVYCHEWVQIKDGTIALIRLKEDLSDVAGPPVTLFKASDAPWTPEDRDRYVTDGPYLYQTQTGRLLMIWSSFTETGYTTGIATSQSGRVQGPWVHMPVPLFRGDGGHGMIFRAFDGTLMLLMHGPNRSPNERACLFELIDTGETLQIAGRR
ncbi:MAG: glycoside hydrolase family 43 protein [Sedimentisphaerales bacterium]|nr:glycoside hydrolase family 43 protein [Sedimentisphaerales bacterium]